MAHKLLLADDSVTIQRVIELTFGDEDVQVIAVGDGQQAIERIDADPPDIILADVDMPKCNGYEVAAYVKRRPNLAHIPVVLLTGAFQPVDQARATAVGSDDVFAKPFEPQVVINGVRQLLTRKAKGGEKKVQDAVAAPPAASARRIEQSGQTAAPRADVSARAAQPESLTAEAEPLSDVTLVERAGATEGAGGTVSLDDFFDQLEAEFASLPRSGPGGPTSQTSTGLQRAESEDFDRSPAPSEPSDSRTPDDWSLLEAPHEGPEPQLPQLPVPAPVDASISTKPEPAAESGPVKSALAWPAATSPTREPHLSSHAIPPMSLPAEPRPSIVDASAALLAAEQDGSAAVIAAPSSSPAPAVTEELIGEIVTRVFQRLGDRVVRETVAETVLRIAERLVQLVREETDRIKATVK